MRRAPRICTCGRKVPAGDTCQCQRDRAREREARRPSAAARGYGSKWRRESRAWLAALGAPKCFCGCGRLADTVEHKQAHKGDHRLMWDRSNWQPAFGACNNRKAARHEGGFGNPVRAIRCD